MNSDIWFPFAYWQASCYYLFIYVDHLRFSKGGHYHESADIGSRMAASSGSHRGLFWTGSQERCAENRIQATIYRPAAGDAVRTSPERTTEMSMWRERDLRRGIEFIMDGHHRKRDEERDKTRFCSSPDFFPHRWQTEIRHEIGQLKKRIEGEVLHFVRDKLRAEQKSIPSPSICNMKGEILCR